MKCKDLLTQSTHGEDDGEPGSVMDCLEDMHEHGQAEEHAEYYPCS